MDFMAVEKSRKFPCFVIQIIHILTIVQFHFVRQKGPKEQTDAFENVQKTKILKF